LLSGVDVQFSSQAAQVAGFGGLETGLAVGTGGQTFTISAAVSSGAITIVVTIASGNWTMDGLARSINTQLSAGVSGGLAGGKAMVVDGEIRIQYEPTSASIASTINISGATAATTLGMTNGSYSGFVQGSKDVTKAAFGFSSYATTAGPVVFSVSDGVVATAISFTVATSATAADMKLFSEWQRSANITLAAATVNVRVDAASGGLAFTSLFVGNKNTTAGSTLSSVGVVVGDPTGVFANKFGLALSSSSIGTGEKNFRLHVVDNTPQFQIGADQGQNMKMSIADMSSKALGVDNLDMTTIEGAQKSLAKITKAIDKVSSERSKLGSFQNRLEYAINNLRSTQSNMTSAESRIRDADMAMEMIEFTRDQIVSQSGTAMLAQANLIPQGVLQLLK
ncbi:MAG TPA: flagellin, partial [Candidatus Ozemobacteraceae bacterium]|nr:flagellin [Candidatus Ozemobacteraceae bacterium]